MNCPRCGRSIPSDAQFCIYCRAKIASQAVEREARPATGPTVRLDPEALPPTLQPRPVTPSAPPYFPAPQRAGQHGRGRRRSAGVGIFPLGMLILFLTGWWWPGILVLLAITAWVDGSGRRQRNGIPALIFFVVLTMLFSTHHLGSALWFFSPFLLVLCMMLPMSIWWWFDGH